MWKFCTRRFGRKYLGIRPFSDEGLSCHWNVIYIFLRLSVAKLVSTSVSSAYAAGKDLIVPEVTVQSEVERPKTPRHAVYHSHTFAKFIHKSKNTQNHYALHIKFHTSHMFIKGITTQGPLYFAPPLECILQRTGW